MKMFIKIVSLTRAAIWLSSMWLVSAQLLIPLIDSGGTRGANAVPGESRTMLESHVLLTKLSCFRPRGLRHPCHLPKLASCKCGEFHPAAAKRSSGSRCFRYIRSLSPGCGIQPDTVSPLSQKMFVVLEGWQSLVNPEGSQASAFTSLG